MGKSGLIGAVICFFCLTPAILKAQFTVQHQQPVAVERNSVLQLEFTVFGISNNNVQSALIFYRYDGDFAYQQQEVDFSNGNFIATIEIQNQNVERLEYYFELITYSGERLTFPAEEPQNEPAQVQIVEPQKDELPPFNLIDYTILSPQEGMGIDQSDILFSIAFFYEEADLPDGKIHLYVDDIDVTSQADTSAYYYSFVPDNLRRGPHKAKLTFKTGTQEYLITQWQFFVIPAGEDIAQSGFASAIMPSGSAELSARNQVIAGDINNAYVGRTQFNGNYRKLKYSFNTYLTTQESSRLQPQNRYGIRMQYSDWWSFDAGHVFPNMSRFTISGRRIHGLNTSLHLLKKNINLQFLYGSLDRKITNLYEKISSEVITSSDNTPIDTTYSLSYEGRGNFQRNIVGGRLGFGNENKFQIGLQMLKIKDDTTSLQNIRSYLDVGTSGSPLTTELSSEDIQKLQQNPELLNVQGGYIKPKDNLIVGSDIKMNLFKEKVHFEAEAVFSALNDNIYNGVLTPERAEELGLDLSENEASLLDQFSWLIIINENMNVLPFKIKEDENGDLQTEAFLPTSLFAGSSELSMRLPYNNVKFQYRWIGPEFNSLANSTIRKDVAGFTLSDRLNLFSNRLYLTLSMEQLEDNVTGYKTATTHTNTYRSNLSWYPIKRKLPRISAGIRYRTRDNGVVRFNPEVPAAFENAAVQNLIIQNGDTLTTSTPRLNNTINLTASVTQQINFIGMVHDASINLSSLETTDEVFAYGDVNSTAVSFNLNTRFRNSPLMTQLGISYNSIESGSGQSSIDIFGIYAGGNYRMMDNKLSLNGRIAVTNNKSTSRIFEIANNTDSNSRNDYFILGAETVNPAYNTFIIQAGAQYDLNEAHSVIFDANLTNVDLSGYSNDRVVQLRYIIRF